MITLQKYLTSVLQRDTLSPAGFEEASWRAVRGPCGKKQPPAKRARNWDAQSNHLQGTDGCQQPYGPGSGSFPSRASDEKPALTGTLTAALQRTQSTQPESQPPETEMINVCCFKPLSLQ